MGNALFKIKSKGNFTKAKNYLTELGNVIDDKSFLNKYGRMGVRALAQRTPTDTGKTADSWKYKIEQTKDSIAIVFYNSNVQNGCNIAILLQFGHGTRNGGWVEGHDYINPAIQPIFDELAEKAWKEVTKL